MSHLKMRTIMSVVRNCFLCTVALCHNFQLCTSACGKTEYEVDGRCCPMCDPGYCVHRHCSKYTPRVCVPCSPSTFTDLPNGLSHCFPCTVCDSSQELRTKTECTLTADSICEPREGFYCIDQHKHSCRSAVEHSKCKPGQYILQKGTADTDTVCTDCVGETYSDGSFSSCLPHTQCNSSTGLLSWEKRPGTNSSDTECGGTQLAPIILTVLFGIIILVGLGLYFCWYEKRKLVLSESSPETDGDNVESQSTRMLNKEKHSHPQSHTAIRQEPEEDAPEDKELNERNGRSGYEQTAVNSKDSRRNHCCSPAHPSEVVSFRNQETGTSSSHTLDTTFSNSFPPAEPCVLRLPDTGAVN